MRYISKDYEPQLGEEAPKMDTVTVKSIELYVPIEPLYKKNNMTKEYKKQLLGFVFTIYNEQRTRIMYKHFVTLKFLGFNIFYADWRTGDDHEGSFYIKWLWFYGDCRKGKITR